MKINFLYPLVFIGALLLASCSTPESRIASNPATFAQLTPEQQTLVKAGRIGVGFDSTAVELALGEPDRITVHTDSLGETLTWHYIEAAYYDGRFIYSGGYFRGYRHGYPYGIDAGIFDSNFPVMQTFDRFRVDFVKNKVVGISEELRP